MAYSIIMKYIKNKNIKESIKIRLINEIENSNIKKSEIAKQIHVTPAVISDYIHKDKLPSLETFALLCEVLGVSSDEILGLI